MHLQGCRCPGEFFSSLVTHFNSEIPLCGPAFVFPCLILCFFPMCSYFFPSPFCFNTVSYTDFWILKFSFLYMCGFLVLIPMSGQNCMPTG